ncbi:MAG UNVERIFIED_CONTAM: RP853 family protein, partial [Rickettsiaceae bacterium]
RLKQNLSEYLLSTLSNMLGLHYASDEKLQKVEKDINHYAEKIGDKLSRYFGHEVILSEGFEVAMELFIIAISPEGYDKDTPPSLINNKNQVVDVVQNLCFGDSDLSNGERQNIASLLGEIIDSPNAHSILSLIYKNPQILRALFQKKSNGKEILETLENAAKVSSKSRKVMEDFIQFAGIITCGIVCFAGNFAAAGLIAPVAAVAVIPTSIIALKYGSQIGEVVGQALAKFEPAFKETKSQLNAIMDQIIPDLKELDIVKNPEIKEYKEIDKTNSKLNDITQDLGKYISTKTEIEKAKDIKLPVQKLSQARSQAVSGHDPQ